MGWAQLWICVGLVIAFRALGVSRHFQASQQLVITRETADCCLGRAGLPVRSSILSPRVLELLKCDRFVARTAGQIGARSLSILHSLTVSNVGTVSETAIGENVTRIAIGR